MFSYIGHQTLLSSENQRELSQLRQMVKNTEGRAEGMKKRGAGRQFYFSVTSR